MLHLRCCWCIELCLAWRASTEMSFHVKKSTTPAGHKYVANKQRCSNKIRNDFLASNRKLME